MANKQVIYWYADHLDAAFPPVHIEDVIGPRKVSAIRYVLSDTAIGGKVGDSEAYSYVSKVQYHVFMRAGIRWVAQHGPVRKFKTRGRAVDHYLRLVRDLLYEDDHAWEVSWK